MTTGDHPARLHSHAQHRSIREKWSSDKAGLSSNILIINNLPNNHLMISQRRWEYIWVGCRKLFETMLVWCDLVFICCQFISWKIRVKWNYLNQVSGLSKLYLNTFQMKLTGRWLAWLTCLVSCRSTSAQYQASSSPGFMDNINFDDFIHSSAPGTYSEGKFHIAIGA